MFTSPEIWFIKHHTSDFCLSSCFFVDLRMVWKFEESLILRFFGHGRIPIVRSWNHTILHMKKGYLQICSRRPFSLFISCYLPVVSPKKWFWMIQTKGIFLWWSSSFSPNNVSYYRMTIFIITTVFLSPTYTHHITRSPLMVDVFQ